MAAAVKFVATWGGGKTLDALADTLQKRMKYLNETAFQSVHAMAIDALKSIRAVTRVAKPSGIKVSVKERTDLRFGYSTQGGAKKMCLRNGGGARVSPSGFKVVYDGGRIKGRKITEAKVFEFTDAVGEKTSKYLIVSSSAANARKVAQNIVAKRILRFAGLAKRAISALMIKTNTKGPADNVPPRVYAKANAVTKKLDAIAKTGDGSGKYSLILIDELRYAAHPNAIKGGSAAVDAALKRSANLSVGLIKHKCKNLLVPGELSTPFPEVKAKRK